MKKKSYRANNPAAVYDTLDLVDNSQPLNANNLPIGMRDGSYAAGTPRDEQEGKCSVGNGSAYVDFGNLPELELQNFKLSFWYNLTSLTGNYAFFGMNHNSSASPDGCGFRIFQSTSNLTFAYFPDNDTSSISIPGYNFVSIGTYYVEIFIYGNIFYLYVDGVFKGTITLDHGIKYLPSGKSSLLTYWNGTSFLTPSDKSIFGVKIDELDTSGNFIQNIAHYKCDSGSTTTLYDSSGNGNHGTIINYYEGFWGTQNVKSWQNDVGYSNRNILNIRTFTGTSLFTDVINTSADNGTAIATWNRETPGKIGILKIPIDGIEIGTSGVLSFYIEHYFGGTVNFTIRAITGSNILFSAAEGRNKYEFNITAKNSQIQIVNEQNKSIGSQFIVSDVNFEYAQDLFYPRDESITLPPFKDVLGNDLQYIGQCPAQADFVESPAWAYFSGSYLSIPGLLTTDTVEVYEGSDVPTIPIDGQLHISTGQIAYGIRILRSGVEWAYYTCIEFIDSADYANLTIFDITEINSPRNATLMNGSLDNQGSQDVFHWSIQGITIGNGSNGAPIGHHIPASSALDGTDALGNPLTITQDGHSFLDTGTKLQHRQMARVVQADTDNILFDTDGNAKQLSWDTINNFGGRSGKYFSSNADISLNQISLHKQPLTRKQYYTELQVRKCDEVSFAFPYTFTFILE